MQHLAASSVAPAQVLCWGGYLSTAELLATSKGTATRAHGPTMLNIGVLCWATRSGCPYLSFTRGFPQKKKPKLFVVRPIPWWRAPLTRTLGPTSCPPLRFSPCSVLPGEREGASCQLGRRAAYFRQLECRLLSCPVQSNPTVFPLVSSRPPPRHPVLSSLADGHREHPGSGAGHASSSWARRHQRRQQGAPAAAAAAAEGPDQGEDPQGRRSCRLSHGRGPRQA